MGSLQTGDEVSFASYITSSQSYLSFLNAHCSSLLVVVLYVFCMAVLIHVPLVVAFYVLSVVVFYVLHDSVVLNSIGGGILCVA